MLIECKLHYFYNHIFIKMKNTAQCRFLSKSGIDHKYPFKMWIMIQ